MNYPVTGTVYYTDGLAAGLNEMLEPPVLPVLALAVLALVGVHRSAAGSRRML